MNGNFNFSKSVLNMAWEWYIILRVLSFRRKSLDMSVLRMYESFFEGGYIK